MKWFFAFNDAGPKFRELTEMIKVAVVTARQKTSLEAFCIYDGPKNSEITKWLEKNCVNLIFHRTPHYEVFKSSMDERGFKTACGAYLRVEIPKVMEINGIVDDYVLYTDCDVMFMGDVVEYLSSIECEYLAAVPGNLTKLDYLNSGVLYMNVKKQQEIYEDFHKYIKDNQGRFSAFDQGAYNQFFKKKWEILDAKMNWRSYWKPNTDAKIIHFQGPKPTQVEAIREKSIPKHQIPLINHFFWENTKAWESKYQEIENPESLNLPSQYPNPKQDKVDNQHGDSKVQETQQKIETTAYSEQDPSFLKSLFELNSIIAQTKTPLQGNVCYPNGSTSDIFQKSPPSNAPHLVLKRKNLISATANRRRMLEIGFNGGHSALIVMHHNPLIELHCVDICINNYTELAAEFLQKKYPNRFYFYKGDSRDVLPTIAVKNRHIKFDILHVDGGHAANVCRTDISNCIRLAANHSVLILDDTSAKHILDIYWEYVRLGFLLPIEKLANTSMGTHRIAQIILNPAEI